MIEKRRSRIHGSGVYASQSIPKNKRIIHYAGEKISNRESLKRELRYIRKGHINHSCRPNCYIDINDGVIWIRAARTIRKGEELTYDYNTDGEGLIKCRCRPACQRFL
jgi:SET domain-containing protein